MSESAGASARRSGPAPGGAHGRLVVISAPSGTGKSSLVRRLLALDPRVAFSISATTRTPRSGERPGVDYHFLTRSEFEARIAAGAFLEHAEVHGNLYGTLRSDVEAMRAAGRDVLLDIDVQGARQVAKADPSAHLIFIAPPSRVELERRIRARGLDAGDVIERRLMNAVGEMAELHRFDSVVVNDELDAAAREFALVVQAGREGSGLTAAQRARIDGIVATFGLPALPASLQRWSS